MFHCAESLATNYWLDFVKGSEFKSLDKEYKTKKGVFSGGFDLKKIDIKQASLFADQFDLKKELKKGNIPSYIHDAAIYFFNHDMASVKNVKVKESETFQDWFFSTRPNELVDVIMPVLLADPIDQSYCENLITLLYDRPKTLYHLFAMLAETSVPKDIGDTMKSHLKGSTSEDKEANSVDLKLKQDVFNVDAEFFPAFLLRDYFKLCFAVSFTKNHLHKFNEGIYAGDFGDSQPNSVYIAPIENILKDFMGFLDANRCEKARLQLLFQALFTVAYPRFKDDKEATVHAIAMLVIEFFLYAMEHPPFIGQEVTDGVRVRPAITKICTCMRNYMYYTKFFPTAKDKELYDLWRASPVIPQLVAYVGRMVAVGNNWKELCEFVNEALDDYYMGTDSVPILKEIEFVTRSFAARGAFLKPFFAGNEKVLLFLEKNPSLDFSKHVMNFQ